MRIEVVRPAGEATGGPELRVTVAGEDEMLAAAAALGRQLQPGDCVALTGPLGAGKTVFARGLAAARGVAPERVTSPTFALLHEYVGELRICHADTYRLDDPSELMELGLADCLAGPAVSVIEWAERLGPYLPPERLDVEIRLPEPAAAEGPAGAGAPAGVRVIRAVGRGRRGAALIEAWQAALAEAAPGAGGEPHAGAGA